MPDITNVTFTPTEKRLLHIFADGQMHSRDELLTALDDDMATPSALRHHIKRMRKKLEPRGELIMYTIHYGTIYYRHVRQLVSE